MGGVFLLLSKISFYGTTLFLVILVLVLSFNFNKKTENKNDNEVSNEYIASYFDGEYQTEIPGKEDGYVVDKIVCDNGATATWDNEEWGINIRNATEKIKCSIYFKFKTEYDFDYTGAEQVFIVPKTGTYKIETWGAQGGNSVAAGVLKSTGGCGGYSTGYIFLNVNDNIYINVGGKGQDGLINQNDILGGYNGGGISHWDKQDDEASGGGGGATHIATKSGLLSLLEDFKSSILIVSGGGGGGSWLYAAGFGGGYVGTSSLNPEHNTESLGGSQLNGYSFGLGGSGIDHIGSPGGGGGSGYYGGFGGTSDGVSGGGGSGYIGNSLLTNKVMYCYNCEESSEESTKTISTTCAEETPTENCAKKGNGYAKITYIE